MNDSHMAQSILQDESHNNTIQNLRIFRTDDNEKLLMMDKSEIIKYYEDLLDKCHDVINSKKERNRVFK
jgi:hypothetical protein